LGDTHRIERRFLANDPEAVTEVVRWVARALASPAFWSLRSEWGDLHQESLRRVVTSLRDGRFDASRDFEAYVVGVARHTALQALDRRRRGRSLTQDAPLHEPVAPGPDAERRTLERQLVRLALEAVSPSCRECLRAYFVEGRNYEELAATQGVPVGTVKSRLFRCLQAAQQAIAESGRGLEPGEGESE
jgi:RNA polymerase sigma-70 factor (ECF subfamily)